MTSSPMASSASARSTGGARGSPPSYRLNLVLFFMTDSSIAGSPVDGLRAVGVLADLAGEVEALERELDRARTLAVVGGAEAVAHLVVELGLPEHRQPGEEVAGGHPLAGRHHGAGLDRVDEQREVEAAEVLADGLGGGGAEQVGEHLGLAALLAGLELDLAAEHLDRGLEVDHAGDRLGLALHRGPVQR